MSYQLIELESDILLSWAYPFTGDLVVADINNVSAAVDGEGNPFTILLPPANLVPTGQSIIFNNIDSNNFRITDSGANPIATVAPGASVNIFLIDSSTSDGLWNVINWGNINGSPVQPMAITAITATSSNTSLAISNGANGTTITPPGGTLTFSLSDSLNNLNSLANATTPGIPIITANSPLRWATRSLVAGTNIAITYPDGVANNPNISLANTLTELTSITIANSSTNITIDSGGVKIANGTNSATLSSTGLALSSSANPIPSNATAWCCFTDTGSGCTSAIVIQSNYNIASVTGSSGVYTVTFTKVLALNNYTVLTSLQRQGSNLTPSLSFVKSKQNSSFVVVCTDTLGNLLPPYDGVSIVVFSS